MNNTATNTATCPTVRKQIGKTTYIVRVAHNEEQRRPPVSQGIQLQLIVRGDLPQLGNIEHGKPCPAGNQNRLGGFARDKLSRTF